MRTKIFHILFLTVILILGNNTLRAEETDSASLTKQVKIEYQSQDESNNPVTLSATLTLPNDSTQLTINKIVLSNTSRNSISSTLVNRLANFSPWSSAIGKSTVIVEPNRVVSGSSKLATVPQYSYYLAGRQSVDALLATIAYLKENGMLQGDNYKSYIVGYGAGANISLATLRSLEKDYTQEQQTTAHLGGTFYAGAEENPMEMWNKAIANDSTYSAYKTIILLDEMLRVNSEGCMKTFAQKDIFSWKLRLSLIPDLIRSGNFTQSQIEKLLLVAFGSESPSIDKLISDDLAKEGSNVRCALEKAIAKNSFSDNWSPETPVYSLGTDLSSIGVNINSAAIRKIIEALKDRLISAEDIFISAAFQKILGTKSLYIPILLYYDSSILMGSLNVDGTMKTTLDVSMYSLFMSKTAGINIAIQPESISTMTETLPGTATIEYDGHGQILFHLDANNVLPILKNITTITGGSFNSLEEAEALAQSLNEVCNSFTQDLNGQKNWATASFGTSDGDTEGTYRLDIMVQRGEQSLGVFTILKLLE